MANCQNLCTAEKCQELERRITELENRLNQHLIQDIPEAHRWNGDLTISLFESGKTLTVEVYIDNIGEDSASINLPFVTSREFDRHVLTQVNGNSDLAHSYYPEIDHELLIIEQDNNIRLFSRIFLEGRLASDDILIPVPKPETNLTVSGFVENKNLFLSIADGISQDTTTIALPFVFQDDFDEHLRLDIPQAHGYDAPPPPSSNLKISGTIANKNLFLSIADGNSQDTTEITLPFVFQEDFDYHLTLGIPEAHNGEKSNLKIDGFFENSYLFLSVADGESSDTANILIPLPEIDLDDMECNLDPVIDAVNNRASELQNAVERENNENQARIDSLSFQVDSKIEELKSQLDNLTNQSSQNEVTGSFEIGTSTQPKDSEGLSQIVGYMQYETSNTVAYSNLSTALSALDQKLTAIHQDVCKSVEMPSTLPNLLLKDCSNLSSLDNLTIQEIQAINQDQADRLKDALTGTPYDSLIPAIESLLTDSNTNFIPTSFNSYVPISQGSNFVDYLNNYQVRQNLKEICSSKTKLNKTYSILGGSYWDNANNLEAPLTLNAEARIKDIGQLQFNEDGTTNAIEINNLLDLIKAYVSVPYHRSGHHRLPATLIESIIKPELEDDLEETTVTIFDSLSFQEWIFKQFDAISGQYPIKFDCKTLDENGNEKTELVTISNSAEAITEILALTLTVAEETDATLNAVMRCLTEARSGANAALLAHDFARANAEYLGYRGRERKKEVDLAFTPGAKGLGDALKPSKQKIIGWDFDDKETLVEIIKKILFSSEIIKAAMYIPFDPKIDNFTGDSIKNTLEKNQQLNDKKWEEFKKLINNPTGRQKIKGKPQANLKDITIDKEGRTQ